jgi:iron complex outermembrane receptor protein
LAAERYGKQKQLSHELQFLGKTERFDFVGGLFYYREKAFNNSPVIFGRQVSQPGVPIPIINPNSYGDLLRVLNKSYAAYAHANLRLTDEIELGGGIRYSKDDRTENDLIAAPRTPTIPRGSFTAKQERVDYDASVKYEFADRSNIYAKFATGFVSGGIFRGVEFRPETIKSYEAGVKSEFLDRRVRLNVAIFQADRKGLQASGFDPSKGGNIFVNAGSQRARGFEVESTFLPVDGLTLTATYGFADVNAKAETTNPAATPVRSQLPRGTGYLAAQYEFPDFPDGTKLSFRVDGQYKGDMFRLSCPVGSLQSPTEGCIGAGDPVLDRQLVIKANWQIGARLTFAEIPVGGSKAKISLWGKNLNDSDRPEFLFPIVGTWVLGTFQQPRTYGIDFGIAF